METIILPPTGIRLPNSIPQGWVLQLKDTKFRTWTSDKSGASVRFTWPKVTIPERFTVFDFLTSLTEAHPELSTAEILKFSLWITQLLTVKVGDTILGVSGRRRIEKMGIVVEFSIDPTEPSKVLHISWNDRWAPKDEYDDRFDEEAEIQPIPRSMIYEAPPPVPAPAAMPPSPESALEGTGAFQVFQEPPRKAEELDYQLVVTEDTQLAPKKDPGGEVRLFYGTNRKKSGERDVNEWYGNGRGELQFGFCRVAIPRGHVQGELERPFKLWFIELAEKKGKHVVIESIEETDEAAFFKDLAEGIDGVPQHDALIFIHGYNTSFAQAARRAAQIAWDVPFYGISGFFSWPSAGALLGYPHDDENATWSVPHLSEFIEKLVTKTRVDRLHLIAHSMGNKLLAFTLKELTDKQTLGQRLKAINQIVLGAPDIDRGVFENQLLPAMRGVGKRLTMYASDKDIALKASEGIRMGLARLGEAGTDLFVALGLDTVDASNVKTELKGHGYVFDTKELLSDMFYLLQDGYDPQRRRLRPRKWKEQLVYWLFPE